MEQYLNDSPADLNAPYNGSGGVGGNNGTNDNQRGNINRPIQYNNNFLPVGNGGEQCLGPTNQFADNYNNLDTATDPLNNFDITNLQNNTDPDFDFNLGYGAIGGPGTGAPLTGNSNPVLSENEYLSPDSGNNFSIPTSNKLGSSLGNDTPFMAVGYDNQGLGSNQYNGQVSPQLGGIPMPIGNIYDNSSSFTGTHGDFGGMSAANTLDGLVSPDNNQIAPDPYLHFSPSQRIPFKLENTTRLGPTAIPTQQLDLLNQGYLSPHQHGFFSPPGANSVLSGNDNSYDTLRSPNTNPNYLYSPKNKPMAMAIPQTSTSTPNTNQLLSPPGNSQLSTSVPSNSAAKSPPPRDIPTKLLTDEEKIKRRKEFHNAVERRRRDLIKQRIKELDAIVPPSLLNPQLCALQAMAINRNLKTKELTELAATMKVKETKANKNTILSKSVVYMSHLKYVLEEQVKARKKLEEEIALLEGESDQGRRSEGQSSRESVPQMSQTQPLPQQRQQQQRVSTPPRSIKQEQFENEQQQSWNTTENSYEQIALSQAPPQLEQFMTNQGFAGELQNFDTSNNGNQFNPDDFFASNGDFNNII